ncbi:major facilitator superfamily domain-containing protein [Polychytrium aggregatum]|uniref:major facilitator superfamily domain-containing protein n=1 Tax=Polychytrium aggregatum TaxID=110093 RepID=UPI0022FF0D00|nr:major facilitator superfamily domain-containing protein [Polychytrium aggregatum]KAI9193382.1 major facilitator superfamily domain-containing protein [Polychytrium aggregatum]
MKTLVPAVVVHILATGMLTIPLQFFILRVICSATRDSNGDADCSSPEVQSIVARWTTMLSLSMAIPGLFAVPVVGALSDRIGRKPVMMLPMVGTLMGTVTLVIIGHYNLSLWPLVLIRLLGGFLGTYGLLTMTAHAYIADVSPPESRTRKFAILEAFTIVGFMFAPLLGGYLGQISTMDVFYLSGIMHIILLVYVVLVLPESFKDPRQRLAHSGGSVSETSVLIPSEVLVATATSNVRHASQSGSLLDSLREFVQSLASVVEEIATNGKSSMLLILVAILFFSMSVSGTTTALLIYTNYRFGWSSLQIAEFLFFRSSLRAFSVSFVLPLVLRGIEHICRIRSAELLIVKIALLISSLAHVILFATTNEWVFCSVLIFDSVSVLALPITKSLLSRNLSSHIQGRLFSLVTLIEQASYICSIVLFGIVYTAAVGTSPSLIFLVDSLFRFAAVVMLLFSAPQRRQFGEALDEEDPDVIGEGRPAGMPLPLEHFIAAHIETGDCDMWMAWATFVG